MRSLAFAALLACSLAPIAAGCATPDDVSDPGTIELSIVHPNPDGSSYVLADAAFEITSVAGTETVYWNNPEPLQLALPPGLASVRLLDGWRLEKYERGGNVPQVLPAALGTVNPVDLRILAGVTASVDFGFIVRTGTGNITVDFGVLTDPRELAGGIRIETATGILAPYVEDVEASRLDFAFSFGLGRLESVVLPDGTKDHVYTAGSYQYRETPFVADFYNDRIGILANEVGPALAAGLLEYHLAARPDGTIELSGGLWAWLGEVVLDIPPYTVTGVLPLGPDGFPADTFFHDGSVPFTMTVTLPSGDGTITGFLNLRHITNGTAP
jgi:hypothetical protein